MRISGINNNFKQNFGANIEINTVAETVGNFSEELSPKKLSLKSSEKVVRAFEKIKSQLPEETIVFSYEAKEMISRVKSTGMELASMNSDLNFFASWPRLIIKTAKKFTEQYVPLVEAMGKVIKK